MVSRARFHAVLALFFVFAPGSMAAAGEPMPLSRNERRQFNYAFATRLGSGIYTISGRTLQVYRLPLSVTFRSEELGDRGGWRLTFPVTFGFYDFKAADILDEGLAHDVATLSLVPGAEFFVPITPKWLLTPYVEAGRVWDREGGEDASVYSAGVWSLLDLAEAGGFELRLGNGLNYTLVEPSSERGTDALVALESAFEARHPMGRSGWVARSDYGLYLAQNIHVQEPEYPFAEPGASGVLVQYEVGVTWGPRDQLRVWKIPVPRIGVGYLFGQDLSVIRFVIGFPFRSLAP